MKLTKKQKEFLDMVCFGKIWNLNDKGQVDAVAVNIYSQNLTEIPVKFGRVSGYFSCCNTNLTTLKNFPVEIGGWVDFHNNTLTEYFKNIKEEDFHHWGILNWILISLEYPFLINIGKKYMESDELNYVLNNYPLTKLYYRD